MVAKHQGRIVELARAGKLSEVWDELRLQEPVHSVPSVIDELRERIERDQELVLHNRPILGATRWYVDEVVYLGGCYYALSLEDGHIMLFLLVYYCDSELIIILEEK